MDKRSKEKCLCQCFICLYYGEIDEWNKVQTLFNGYVCKEQKSNNNKQKVKSYIFPILGTSKYINKIQLNENQVVLLFPWNEQTKLSLSLSPSLSPSLSCSRSLSLSLPPLSFINATLVCNKNDIIKIHGRSEQKILFCKSHTCF